MISISPGPLYRRKLAIFNSVVKVILSGKNIVIRSV